ncbi:MAG: hypothetical protein JO266_10055 [Acidobacteria bacterium]|nr:hypothetical protein [Acidobacteriota bacterium]
MKVRLPRCAARRISSRSPPPLVEEKIERLADLPRRAATPPTCGRWLTLTDIAEGAVAAPGKARRKRAAAGKDAQGHGDQITTSPGA